jgi:transposase
MTKAYSIDLRERIIRAVGRGASAREAARIFFVSPSSAIKWIQRWRATGSCARSPVRGHRRSPLIDHADWLLALIAGQPDITLEEMRSLMGERGVSTSVASLWRFFDLRGVSFKKKSSRSRAIARRRGSGPRSLEARSSRT